VILKEILGFRASEGIYIALRGVISMVLYDKIIDYSYNIAIFNQNIG